MLNRSLICRLIPMLVVLASAAPALAQAAPSNAPEQGELVSYGIAALSLVAIIALSVMSAKRTHQD